MLSSTRQSGARRHPIVAVSNRASLSLDVLRSDSEVRQTSGRPDGLVDARTRSCHKEKSDDSSDAAREAVGTRGGKRDRGCLPLRPGSPPRVQGVDATPPCWAESRCSSRSPRVCSTQCSTREAVIAHRKRNDN